jgi:hypothetical protein
MFSVMKTRTTSAIVAAVIAGLLSAFLTVIAPAPADASCLTPTGMCAEVTTDVTGNTESVPPSGGTCNEKDNVSPDTYCGYAKFDVKYVGSMLQTDPTPLPPVLSPVYAASGTPNGYYQSVAYNQYKDQCKTPRKEIDPITGKADYIPARGVYWADTRSWTFVTTTTSSTTITNKLMAKGAVFDWARSYNQFTGGWVITKGYKATIAGYYNVAVTTTTSTTTKYYSGRSVSYSCDYPAGIQHYVKQCPTSIGPGTMIGPVDNTKTNPRFPVKLADGTVDPLTMKRTWNAIAKPDTSKGEKFIDGVLYSKVGLAIKSNPALYRTAAPHSDAIGTIANCPDLKYNAIVSNTECFDTNGNYVTNSPSICTFSPGNYHKIAPGKQTVCEYYTYPYRSAPQVTAYFKGCSVPPKECSTSNCFVDDWAAWYCDGSAANGKDIDYNFANCGLTDKEEQAVCSAVPNPTIYDPDNIKITNGSQVVANGKALKVYWPAVTPKIPTSSGWINKIENKKLQWFVVKNSQPLKAGSANAANQPVWGNPDKNASDSMLTQSSAGPGQIGWANTSLFLKFFQGTKTNTGAGFTFGSGEVANTVKVKAGTTTATNNDLIPFGVYGVYSFTIPRRITTAIGGSQIKNIPITCTTNMAYFYSVSGRVTG